MLYAFYCEDIPNTLAQRQQARPEHLARLNALLNQGRLVLAGPCPAIDSNAPGDAGFTGSVVIAEFDDLAAAQEWADNDPYIKAGVYAKVTVKPFIKALP